MAVAGARGGGLEAPPLGRGSRYWRLNLTDGLERVGLIIRVVGLMSQTRETWIALSK